MPQYRRAARGTPGLPKSIGHETIDGFGRPFCRRAENKRARRSRLQRDGRYARTVSIKVRFSDFDTVTRQRRTPNGVRSAAQIMNAAETLLDSLRSGDRSSLSLCI